MSSGIGRRLINLARAELNSLLERASQAEDADGGDDERDGWSGLESLSDAELLAELERRRQAREEADRAARARPTGGGTGRRTAGTGAARPGAGEAPRPARAPTDEVARAYAALEVPLGSDFETVRKAYRNLMRKYHPDRHTASPEKQKAANELAQRLTDAYKTLEKRLRPKR